MAQTRDPLGQGIDQITTLDVGPAPIPQAAPTPAAAPVGGPLSKTQAPNQGPQPNATGGEAPQGAPSDPTSGVGIDGEMEVWEGHYAMRNFLGRVIFLGILAIAWLGLAIYAWGYDHTGLTAPAIIGGILLAFFAIATVVSMLRARLAHKYRLTTRRLFVSTGIFGRETDQLELLRVQDVFNRQQGLKERLMNVGSVIVVSNEKAMPNYVLLGVSDPKGLMDLIWHHARAEQDQRSVRVEQM